MRNQILKFLAVILLLVGTAFTNNISAQVKPYRVTDRQVQTVVSRIQTRTANFKQAVSLALDRGALNGTPTEDRFYENIGDFEQANTSLSQSVGSRNSTVNDVNNLLNSASVINQFMTDNRLNVTAQTQWRNLKTDLNTLAVYYGVTWNQNAVNPTNNNNYPPNNYPNNGNNNGSNYPNNNPTGNAPYNTSNTNLTTLLSRVQSRIDTYKRELGYAFDRSMINNSRSEATINSNVADFETATARLRQNIDSRRSQQSDVQDVLNRAYYIDSFMRDYRLGTGAETQWNLIRTDLTTLAGYYNVSWNWNRPNQPGNNNFDTNITGTYRLNSALSDDVSTVVDRAVNTNTVVNQRDNNRRALQRRLSSPDLLAIDKRGSAVTIASSLSPQITFQADGTARSETTPNGRTIKTTANSTYNGIDLNYEGDRINDFYISFMSVSNNQLRVVRRVYLENSNSTVTVSSVYDKTDNVAQFSSVNNGNNGNNGNYPNNGNSNSGNSNDFIIANNTIVTATLQNPIDTKNSQVGDRFQLVVNSPSQYNGAVIEGRVTNADKSGRVSGRANISMEFDTIRLTNGQTYRFAGYINSVKTASGEDVSVNSEGTVRDSNQTTKTVTRAGIGAALGAIIGAIAGGGSGAAIGAGVGAGAGAGTVILQGRDNIELLQGTTFSLTATAPANVNR